MVFSRASCPAFTITTNGETGIRQLVQEIFLVASHQAILGEHPGSSLSVWRRSCTPRLFPAISRLPPPTCWGMATIRVQFRHFSNMTVVPTESDRTLAKESRKIIKDCLSESGSCRVKILIDGVERETQIPMMALRLLAEALRQIAMGKGVVVLPLDAEISTQQAADILNVSRGAGCPLSLGPFIVRVQTQQGLRISLLQMTSTSLQCEIRCVFLDQIHRNRGRKRGIRSQRRRYSLRGEHGIFLAPDFAFQVYKHPHHTSPDIIP
jgi:hypothetical protein